MRSVISRWFMFGLLLGGAISHATVLAQGTTSSSSSGQQPGATADSTGSSAQAALAGKGSSTSVDGIRKALDKAITLDFTGSLHDALNQIRDRTGLPIKAGQSMGATITVGNDPLVGPPAGSQVEVKAKNEKAGAVLRRLLNGQRLTYVILEDSVLITSEAMATLTQMRQRIAVDVEDVPLKKAARDLAKNYGVSLVIDPKVAKEAEAPVSLHLDNVSVETGFRLLAEMASLKAVRMGNVMFITHETKAEKIRKEEQDQYDHPLNMGGFGSPIMQEGAPVKIMPMPPVPPFPVPAPPPGIDLPPAVPNAGAAPGQPAPKKVIDIRNPPLPPPPPPIPGTAAPAGRPPVSPMQSNRDER